jgi:hypothetical protein
LIRHPEPQISRAFACRNTLHLRKPRSRKVGQNPGKAASEGLADRYGVAGIAPISDLPISASYAGPFHSPADNCSIHQHDD